MCEDGQLSARRVGMSCSALGRVQTTIGEGTYMGVRASLHRICTATEGMQVHSVTTGLIGFLFGVSAWRRGMGTLSYMSRRAINAIAYVTNTANRYPDSIILRRGKATGISSSSP